MIKRAASLKTQAYNLILEAIMRNEIEPDQVYSEQWFATRFHISRTPVREALLQLREEGMIETKLARGIIVKPISLKDAREIFQVRMAIEGFCSATLAGEVREGNPQALKTLERVETLLGNEAAGFSDLDLQFHYEIVNFSDNQNFVQITEQKRNRINLYWDTSRNIPERVKKSHQEHQRIFEALRSGSEEKAYMLSTEHLRNVYRDIVEVLKS